MKPFRFSLQALLTLRQRQEKLALEEYGRAVSARQRAIEEVLLARRWCQTAWAAWQEAIAHEATAGRIAQLQMYGAQVEELRKEAQTHLENAQHVLDQRWRQLIKARQEREAVESFQDRQRELYERELQREDQKLLDDMARRRSPMASCRLNAELVRN